MDEADRIAPVIPLFGGKGVRTDRPFETAREDVGDSVSPRPSHGEGEWRSSWGRVVDLDDSEHGSPGEHHPARGGVDRARPALRALQPSEPHTEQIDDAAAARVREAAEELLVRRLRTRSLSVSEARAVLKGFELQGLRLDGDQVDDAIEEFGRRGYLDDTVLAEQLVSSGVDRKGQGRVGLARALAQRGISREVIDAALEELPDDDFERALEFARAKLPSLARYDSETVKRRLSGQLARRGYSGGVVSSVLRTVMTVQGPSRPSSGVRFE